MDSVTGVGRTVTPGERIARSSLYQAGWGTFEHGNVIYAAILGNVKFREASPSEDKNNKLPICWVSGKTVKAQLPEVNSHVICRVMRVSPKRVDCDILCVEGTCLLEPFKGIVRLQDVREYQLEQIRILDCFRPQDIIRCLVLSIGDARSCILSTATIDLGVILATSLNGGILEPVSWKFMRCSKTGLLERRKVAKPIHLEPAQEAKSNEAAAEATKAA